MSNMRLLPLLFLFPSCVFSQAWLSPKGQGTFSLLYQYGFDRYHTFSNGQAVDRGHIFLQALMTEVDYSLTERLAVRIALPYIQGKYKGTNPHTLIRGRTDTKVELDNGSYHGALQDFRFDLRYNLSSRPLMFTSFFQTILPSHSYPTLAHAAVGTHQREYRMGVNLGRRLNPILPKAYVQGRYAFGFVQRTANIAPRRSYGEFQLGYFLSRRLSVQGSIVGIRSHNGIEYIYGLYPNNLTDEEWLNHDRISRTRLLDVGGAVTYAFNRSSSFLFGLGHSLYGTNNHLRSAVVTVGVTKSFATRSSAEKVSGQALLPEPNKALVCTCAKSK